MKYINEKNPICSIYFVINDLTISIDKKQFDSFLSFVSQLSYNKKISKYKRFRPDCRPDNKKNVF